jgi:hypothetical protein
MDEGASLADRSSNKLNWQGFGNPRKGISMKKLFACALLTAVSLLPAPKAAEAAPPPCEEYCFSADYNRLCQTAEGNRITCFEYLYWGWGPINP